MCMHINVYGGILGILGILGLHLVDVRNYMHHMVAQVFHTNHEDTNVICTNNDEYEIIMYH